ncbi:hypothetical protein PAXRUDRAFT_155352 [Paxillus rubicundulus Ve08.2h10]|uniref:Uncharacterized protein n=1 Tax=Paxillus rubicundulus Ve08.2h10 TaxID=930991 RepID=A0A0D0DQM6_9AGAM|nr:hypothetical protein PAXRUDRAFT_155352 [Paxillus rubicundulus Ve08.2h10]
MDTIINNNHNVSTLGDVIIMDINKLHPAWKTYFIDVTPSEPGPLKLVLHLKAKQNTSKGKIDSTNPVNQSTSENSEPPTGSDPNITIIEPEKAINPHKASLCPCTSMTTSTTHIQTPRTRRPWEKVVAKPIQVLHLPKKPKDSMGMEIKSNNKLNNVMINPNNFPPHCPLAAFCITPAQAVYDTAVAQYNKN